MDNLESEDAAMYKGLLDTIKQSDELTVLDDICKLIDVENIKALVALLKKYSCGITLWDVGEQTSWKLCECTSLCSTSNISHTTHVNLLITRYRQVFYHYDLLVPKAQ